MSAVDTFYEELADLLQEGSTAVDKEGPALLTRLMQTPGAFESLEFLPAADKYTRNRVYIRGDGPVIYVMEWPPGSVLMPHDHHDEFCFEYLLEGQLVITNWIAEPLSPEDNTPERFNLKLHNTKIVEPGETASVNRAVTDIHSVYAPVRTHTIHVYEHDHSSAFGFVRNDDDSYTRTEFVLKH